MQINPWLINIAVFVTKVLVGLLVVLGVSKLVGPLPISVSSIVTQKSDVYSVTGEGRVSIKPDIAVVNLGVQANASTVKQAQQIMNTKTNAVTGAIKKLGISEDDIKTENYNIYPNYDYGLTPFNTHVSEPTSSSGALVNEVRSQKEPVDQRITSYNANTNLRIKIKDIDKVNSVVDAATTAGGNQIGGISFDVENRDEAKDQARKEAVENAKKKAQEASSVAGFKLGKMINYSESDRGSVSFYDRAALPAVGGNAPEETDIQPGTNEIVINVTLSYEIQ